MQIFVVQPKLKPTIFCRDRKQLVKCIVYVFLEMCKFFGSVQIEIPNSNLQNALYFQKLPSDLFSATHVHSQKKKNLLVSEMSESLKSFTSPLRLSSTVSTLCEQKTRGTDCREKEPPVYQDESSNFQASCQDSCTRLEDLQPQPWGTWQERLMHGYLCLGRERHRWPTERRAMPVYRYGYRLAVSQGRKQMFFQVQCSAKSCNAPVANDYTGRQCLSAAAAAASAAR